MAETQSHTDSPFGEQKGFMWTLDRLLTKMVTAICGILILMTVVFTCYTIVMRYVFLNPPFWGDTVALFANIWMVLLALGLSVRSRDQIAMQALYTRIAPSFAFWLEVVWTLLILAFAIFMIVVGGQAALQVPGQFWELGELPKSYPMMILPISGVLVALAAIAVLVEDWLRWRRGDLTVMPNET